jgi:long-chain-fatty-acid--CoA ligase ACSBG
MQTNVDTDTTKPLSTLTSDVIHWCRSLGSSATSVRDVINDEALNNAIQDGIDDVNRKATSNAQRIQKWMILPNDFSLAGGELGSQNMILASFKCK